MDMSQIFSKNKKKQKSSQKLYLISTTSLSQWQLLLTNTTVPGSRSLQKFKSQWVTNMDKSVVSIHRYQETWVQKVWRDVMGEPSQPLNYNRPSRNDKSPGSRVVKSMWSNSLWKCRKIHFKHFFGWWFYFNWQETCTQHYPITTTGAYITKGRREFTKDKRRDIPTYLCLKLPRSWNN